MAAKAFEREIRFDLKVALTGSEKIPYFVLTLKKLIEDGGYKIVVTTSEVGSGVVYFNMKSIGSTPINVLIRQNGKGVFLEMFQKSKPAYGFNSKELMAISGEYMHNMFCDVLIDKVFHSLFGDIHEL